MHKVMHPEVLRLDAELKNEELFLIRVACIIAIIGFYLYLIVDFQLAPESIWKLAAARTATSIIILSLWKMAGSNRVRSNSYVLAALFFGSVCMGIIACAVLVGKHKNWYYEPLALMFICYAGFLPTTFKAAGGMFAAVIIAYVGAMLAFDEAVDQTRLVQIAFLLGLASVIGVTFSYANQLLHVRARAAEMLEIEAQDALKDSLEATRTAVKQLNTANELLKATDEAKNALLANISHELRTPLTIILAGIEDLQSKLESQKQHAVTFSELDKSSLRLLWLIDEILELTRLESPQASLKQSIWSMSDFLNELAKTARALASRKAIKIVYVPSNSPLYVFADRSCIDRVVLNLLTNAIKFTPAGGTITVTLRRKDDAAIVEVADTGAGISEADLPRVFERFYQGESGKKVYRGGVGIGLSMCEKIVLLHKGAINITSQVGMGTRVTVSLPHTASTAEALAHLGSRDTPSPQETAAAQQEGLPEWSERIRSQDKYRLSAISEVSDRGVAPIQNGPPKAHKLLVVDDNPSIVSVVKNIACAEFTVYVALDGVEGLEQARRLHPDIIVSDVVMPKMTGFELLKAVRLDAGLRDVPVILMTARGDEQDRQRSAEYAADAFLPKPFGAKELLPLLNNLVTRQQSHIEQVTQAAQSAVNLAVSGLAHDIMNPISFIKSASMTMARVFSSVVQRGEQAGLALDEEKLNHENVRQVVRSGLERVTEAVEHLKRYAKGQDSGQPVVVPFTPMVQRTVVVGKGTADIVEILASKAKVAVKPGQIERVLLNLILNAIQAGGEKCRITVKTLDDSARNMAVVQVTDNGPGMDAATLKRVCEPGFTTKAGGSGLGLMMCREIIQSHGGTLEADSILGCGATFTVSLPMCS